MEQSVTASKSATGLCVLRRIIFNYYYRGGYFLVIVFFFFAFQREGNVVSFV